ncbi:zinc ribbon domain-containing protein [Shimia sp.]|uniref:zinc ribbon domain-containing protein n=1 Tax=Shimia sp. TaxID=1954381 RepID=UPI003297112B
MKNMCQSCGMPLSQDPAGGGTEADGSKSTTYCSYCYDNGAFLMPEISAQGMQVFCKNKLIEMGQPRNLAWLYTRGIPRLKRWRS